VPRLGLPPWGGGGGGREEPTLALARRKILHPIATPEQMIGKGVFNIKYNVGVALGGKSRMPKIKMPSFGGLKKSKKGGFYGVF
jgi:hypothetical protein